VHEGSEGCSVAHDRELMRGWALDVRGAIAARPTGRVSSFSGKRVGEMNALKQPVSNHDPGHDRIRRLTASLDGPSGKDPPQCRTSWATECSGGAQPASNAGRPTNA